MDTVSGMMVPASQPPMVHTTLTATSTPAPLAAPSVRSQPTMSSSALLRPMVTALWPQKSSPVTLPAAPVRTPRTLPVLLATLPNTWSVGSVRIVRILTQRPACREMPTSRPSVCWGTLLASLLLALPQQEAFAKLVLRTAYNVTLRGQEIVMLVDVPQVSWLLSALATALPALGVVLSAALTTLGTVKNALTVNTLRAEFAMHAFRLVPHAKTAQPAAAATSDIR